MPDLPQPGCVYLDGQFVRPDEARISTFDAGFLYGDGIYETLRTYGGRPFRMQAHLERLRQGVDLLEIPPPTADLPALVEETLRRASLEEAYLRITVTRGVRSEEPTLVIAALPIRRWPEEVYVRGAKVKRLWQRAAGEWPPPTVKSTSIQRSMLARARVQREGADEGVFLAPDGSIAEGTVTNVFAVYGSTLHTPLADVCLPGVTRAEVLSLASECGLDASEGPLWVERLLSADEVFLTNTLAELVPVTRFEGEVIGTGAPGPVWRKLLDAYQRRTRGEP